MKQVDVKKLITDIQESFPVEPILRDEDDWVSGYKDGKETMREQIIGFLEEYFK